MKTASWCLRAIAFVLSAICVISPAGAETGENRPKARQILDAADVRGGLVVHVGCSDGKLTAALRAGESYLVQGLDRDETNVEKAREHISLLGLYGKVTVDRLAGNRLPYIDNLVKLVVSENLDGVPMDEVMRVLCPGAVAYIKQNGKWKRTVKSRPPEIDEWTHYLHGSDNNAVAKDSVVASPFHAQWIGDPKWARRRAANACSQSKPRLVTLSGKNRTPIHTN
ncbi:MAG: class I SAM-dependent methyltransferase [Phycisphaerales bacterium]|nr:MAG: class I SAM-dependent methyltransferase [Phycisphaerales bacterium]